MGWWSWLVQSTDNVRGDGLGWSGGGERVVVVVRLVREGGENGLMRRMERMEINCFVGGDVLMVL